jgi:hypothetical protein
MGLLLFYLGVIICIGAYIWFVALAFSEDLWWGIGCLCCGIVQILFFFLHLNETWKPLVAYIAGALLMGAAATIDPQVAEMLDRR